MKYPSSDTLPKANLMSRSGMTDGNLDGSKMEFIAIRNNVSVNWTRPDQPRAPFCPSVNFGYAGRNDMG